MLAFLTASKLANQHSPIGGPSIFPPHRKAIINQPCIDVHTIAPDGSQVTAMLRVLATIC